MHVNINKIIHVSDQTCHTYHQTCDPLPEFPCVFKVTESDKNEFNCEQPCVGNKFLQNYLAVNI